jgi:endonuclease/exonuclease/phosphatase family metal-dependent hydrolase
MFCNRFLVILISVCFCIGGKSDSECPIVSLQGVSKTTGFRIVQYNAEWLFMDYYAPMNCPGSGCTWANETEAQKHIQTVGSVVSTLHPDIMNVCEVEGCDELDLLRYQVVNGTDYQIYLKQGTDTATGQNVGLMTKWSPNTNLTRTESRMSYPLEGSMCGYTGTPGTVGVSKHYITEYVFYGRPTLFIGLHLLAYPEDATRCAEREAQAQIIQNIIATYEGEVIVLGDFNDFDGRVLDANRNIPSSRVLDILKGIDGEKKGIYELRSAAEKMPEVERFSDWWDENGDCVSTANEFSMIDYVLVTPFLFDNIKSAFVYHGYDEFCGKYNSDHSQFVVDFW